MEPVTGQIKQACGFRQFHGRMSQLRWCQPIGSVL
jgi:hypothetical protein